MTINNVDNDANQSFLRDQQSLFDDLRGAVHREAEKEIRTETTSLLNKIVFYPPKQRIDLCNQAITILNDHNLISEDFDKHIEATITGIKLSDIAIRMKKARSSFLSVAEQFMRAFEADPSAPIYAADAGRWFSKAGAREQAENALLLAVTDHALIPLNYKSSASWDYDRAMQRLRKIYKQSGAPEKARALIIYEERMCLKK